ncbi:cation:proton antiporter [Nocardioides sp. LHG3406-4]|uniref:cation:proton antiporter n=1 Tax=Nocardioides sp. LHG3406-4 TaxID=2804575 RepID=UPI003CF60D20
MSATMAVFALVVIAFVALSARAARAYVSAPMVFMLAGFVLGNTSFYDLEATGIKAVAEATLALLLFHGAAELRPRDLFTESFLTGRLLLVALPMTVVGTFLLVRLLFPGIDVWLAVVLAAALAPTDSTLSAATVLNPRVPTRVRRMLSLESGLNDGLATPVVLFAIAAAAGISDGPGNSHGALRALLAVAIGVAFGSLTGRAAGRVLRTARRRGWAEDNLLPLAVLVIPLLCYYGADVLGGNGFMAAFIAGTTYATTHASAAEASGDLELTRLTSALLAGAAWMLFGAATATYLASLVHWRTLLVAVLSLTVLRMAPVALSLAGSGIRGPTRLFVGWFGPRGLPSVVFALIANDALVGWPGADTVVATIAAAVVISVLAHGLTAPPWSESYAAWARRTAPPTETS